MCRRRWISWMCSGEARICRGWRRRRSGLRRRCCGCSWGLRTRRRRRRRGRRDWWWWRMRVCWWSIRGGGEERGIKIGKWKVGAAPEGSALFFLAGSQDAKGEILGPRRAQDDRMRRERDARFRRQRSGYGGQAEDEEKKKTARCGVKSRFDGPPRMAGPTVGLRVGVGLREEGASECGP